MIKNNNKASKCQIQSNLSEIFFLKSILRNCSLLSNLNTIAIASVSSSLPGKHHPRAAVVLIAFCLMSAIQSPGAHSDQLSNQNVFISISQWLDAVM